MLSNKVIIYRLFLASILGGLIGAEREMSRRPAGLRTHILVTLGSCLIMVVSVGNTSGDEYRMAAQVVSGIGFLGAGTIMQKKNEVGGLTTAASVWIAGGIGLAVGDGYYLPSIVTTLIVLFTLVSLALYEKSYWGKGYRLVEIRYDNEYGMFESLAKVLRESGVRVKGMYFFGNFDIQDGERVVKYKVKNLNRTNETEVRESIMHIKGVKDVAFVECTMDKVRQEEFY